MANRNEKALDSVLADRGASYGDFFGHARTTQEMKLAFHHTLASNPQFHNLPPREQNIIRESADMIMHKMGRIANGKSDLVDSWLDIEGYARLVRERLEGGPMPHSTITTGHQEVRG